MRKLLEKIAGCFKDRLTRKKNSILKTGIAEDLIKICRLTVPSFNLSDHASRVSESSFADEIEFRFELNADKVRELMRDSDVEINMELCHDLPYARISIWKMPIDEYNKLFRTHYLKFIKEKVEPLILLLEENLSNPYYQFIFIKYELSVSTIATTFEEAIELNGEVGQELKDKAVNILSKFVFEIEEKKKELKELKKRDKEAINKSLLERLQFEEDFISR